MDRCLACQQELWGDESSCPECGAPVRPNAARVDTRVRDRFVAGALARATPDADFEYAFGGKRSVLQASAAPKTKERGSRFGRRRSRVVPTEMGDEGKGGAATTVTDLLRTVRDTWRIADGVPRPYEEEPDDERPVASVVEAEEDAQPAAAAVGAIVEAPPEPRSIEGNNDNDVEALEPPTAKRPRRFSLRRRSRDVAPDEDVAASHEGPAPELAVATPPDDDALTVVEVPVVEEAPAAVDEEIVPETALVAEAPRDEGTGSVPRKRQRQLVPAIALIVVAAVVTTGVVLRSDRERAPVSSPRVVASTTDDISFLLPGGWRLESQGKGVMELTDSDSDSRVYATVIKRKSLKDGLTLQERARQVRTQLLRSLDAAQMSKPVSTKIGTYDAIRTEVSAEAVGRSVSYIHTVVKTPKDFVNILAWAPADKMGAERDELLGIVESFRSTV